MVAGHIYNGTVSVVTSHVTSLNETPRIIWSHTILGYYTLASQSKQAVEKHQLSKLIAVIISEVWRQKQVLHSHSGLKWFKVKNTF